MKLALSADSSWNRWHPTYRTLGERCQQLGIDSLEMVYYPENPGFAEAPKTLAEFGVNVVCVNATAKYRVNIGDASLAQKQIIECVDLAGDLGARYVIMYPGHNKLWDYKETVELFRRRIDPCVARAVDRGVTLLLENHFDLRGEDPEGRDVVRNADMMAVFLDALDCPQIKVNFDAGNVYAAGIEPWPYAYRLLRDHIAYAHLKDMTRFSELQHGPLAENETLADSRHGVFLPVAVGDGGINYWGLLREMTEDDVVEFATFEDHSLASKAESIYERGVSYAREAMDSVRNRA